MLGDETTEVSSQLLIALYTDDIAEAQGWLPEGQISGLSGPCWVYLGWRYKARIQLTVPARLLPAPVLGEPPYARHDRDTGRGGEESPPDIPATLYY